MKVVIVGPAYPYRGGIADTNEAFCRALNGAGHEAIILTFTMQYPEFLFPGKTQYSTDTAPNDIQIIRGINTLNPLSWLNAVKTIHGLNPEVVIFRFWLPLLGMALGSIARLLDKKIKVLALCDNIIPHEKRFGDVALTRYFLRPMDGFITMSRTVYEELNSFSTKPKIYQPHPINIQFENKVNVQEARRKLGFDIDGKYLLFFGLVRKYKGLDIMIEVLSHPLMVDLNIKLLVVGEFYDDISIYEKLIEKFNVQDRILITNKFIPTSDVKFYFSAADLITQTYHTASQSGVTQIAYQFDRPVLVTNVGGLSEYVVEGKTGYVTSKNIDDIAERIAFHFNENSMADMESHISIEKEKYSWPAFVQSTIDFYNSL